MKKYQKNAFLLFLLGICVKLFLGEIIILLIDWRFYNFIYKDFYLDYIIPFVFFAWGVKLLVNKNEEDGWSLKSFTNKIKSLTSLFYNNTTSKNLNHMENFNPKKIVSAGRKFLIGICIAILTYLVCFGTLYLNGYRDSIEFVLGMGIVGGITTFYLYISAALDLMNCEK